MISLPGSSLGCALPAKTSCRDPVRRAISRQASDVGEDQVGPLVGRGSARETDGEVSAREGAIGPVADLFEKFVLGLDVRRPDLLLRDLDRVAQRERVAGPSGNVTVEETTEAVARPGKGVHSVGDRVDRVSGEHLLRDLAVPLGHAVDVMGKVQREPRHVEPVLASQHPDLLGGQGLAQHLLHELVGELVVSRRDRRVRREDAAPPDVFDVSRDVFGVRLRAQELQREKARMPFVHVKPPDAGVPEGAEHADSADAEHDLLREAVPFVSAVERRRSARGPAANSPGRSCPGEGAGRCSPRNPSRRTDRRGSPPGGSQSSRKPEREAAARPPSGSHSTALSRWLPSRVDGLPEVPLRIEERDADDRQPQVGEGREACRPRARPGRRCTSADGRRGRPPSRSRRRAGRRRSSEAPAARGSPSIAVGVGEEEAPAVLRAEEERAPLVAGRAAARRIDRHPAHRVVNDVGQGTLSGRLTASAR